MTKWAQVLLLSLLSLFLASSASAQGSFFTGNAWRYTPSGIFAASGATVTVCTALGSGTPCTPTISLFKDSALASPVSNPLPVCSGTPPQFGCVDGLGNFSFYASTTGPYVYTITGAGLTAYGPIPIFSSLSPAQANNFTAPQTFSKINGAYVLDGTKYPATQAGFAQLISDAPAGAEVFIPANTAVSLTSSMGISKNLNVHCGNKWTSVISGPAGAAQFTITGTIQSLDIVNCNLNNAGQVLDTTGATTSEGRFIFENNFVNHMTNATGAFVLGHATYWDSFYKNNFSTNVSSIFIKDNSDTVISDNEFEFPQSGCSITIQGGNVHVVHNTFIYGSPNGTGTAADICFNPKTGLLNGAEFIQDNKFGSEGEVANRLKFSVSGDAGQIFGDTRVTGNYFGCLQGNTVIQFANQIHDWYFGAGNIYNNCGKIIDDAFTPVNGNLGASSIFDSGNVIVNSGPTAVQLFTNGGREFGQVVPPLLTSDVHQAVGNIWPRDNESNVGLRNRLTQSEAFTNVAWVASGGTITPSCGVTDPWGTTRACTLTTTNSTSNISAGIDTTSLGNSVVVTFWAQSGTVNLLEAALNDNTAGVSQPDPPAFTLQSTWRKLKFNVNGINSAHTFSLLFLPKGTGTLNICCAQVADRDTDYIPTAGAAVTSTAGNRYELVARYAKGVGFEGTTSGLITLVPANAATGTPTIKLPFNTGTLPTVYSCGTTTACANTDPVGNLHIEYGSVALASGTPSTATITGMTAFASSTSYVCTLTNATTQANPVKAANVSGTSFTITGPNTVTDTINYQCVGN